jgi:hypothetical protein
MIQINLLKKASSRRGGSGVPFVKIGLVGLGALAIVVVSAVIMRSWLEHPRIAPVAAATVAPQPPEPVEQPVAAAPVAPQMPEPVEQPVAEAPVAPQSPEPVKQPVAAAPVAPQPPEPVKQPVAAAPVAPQPPEPVKQPVPESSALKPVSDEKDVLRKINSDVAFAKLVFQELTDAVPEGIGFSALSIDSFSTVTGVGTGAMREQVSALFINLRRAPMNLQGLPASYIGNNNGEGYSFMFVCKPSFGNAPADSLLAAAGLVSQKKLPLVIKTFSKIAVRSGLTLPKGLSRKAVWKADGYTHNTYRFLCSGTYKNFVSFVLNCDQAQVLCAFVSVRLTARSAAIVDISADIDFITRE